MVVTAAVVTGAAVVVAAVVVMGAGGVVALVVTAAVVAAWVTVIAVDDVVGRTVVPTGERHCGDGRADRCGGYRQRGCRAASGGAGCDGSCADSAAAP